MISPNTIEFADYTEGQGIAGENFEVDTNHSLDALAITAAGLYFAAKAAGGGSGDRTLSDKVAKANKQSEDKAAQRGIRPPQVPAPRKPQE